jgi:hypothetical protein
MGAFDLEIHASELSRKQAHVTGRHNAMRHRRVCAGDRTKLELLDSRMEGQALLDPVLFYPFSYSTFHRRH